MKASFRLFLIVLSIILVLAMASCGPKDLDCDFCFGEGKFACKTMKMQEYLSGEKQYNHDCRSCTNGIQICDECNGTGKQPVD